MASFKVLIQHDGDKQYWVGDTREANEADVKHLVQMGVLAPVSAKAAPGHSNKMEPAPENKALSGMTKAELIDAARVRGVDIETDDNKADLIRKIEKASR